MARTRKPTELAQLTGADRKNPQRYKTRGSSKDCTMIHANKPEFRNPETSNAWDSVVPALEALHILTIQDLPRLMEMFSHYDHYIDLDKQLVQFRKDHWVEMLTSTDMQLLNQQKSIITQRSQLWSDFDKLASRFGMSPVDRANIVIPEQQADDPLDIVLGGK